MQGERKGNSTRTEKHRGPLQCGANELDGLGQNGELGSLAPLAYMRDPSPLQSVLLPFMRMSSFWTPDEARGRGGARAY